MKVLKNIDGRLPSYSLKRNTEYRAAVLGIYPKKDDDYHPNINFSYPCIFVSRFLVDL